MSNGNRARIQVKRSLNSFDLSATGWPVGIYIYSRICCFLWISKPARDHLDEVYIEDQQHVENNRLQPANQHFALIDPQENHL